MALDSAQKRGSAMNLSQPFRPWVLIPTGGINAQSERQVVLRLCSAVGTQPSPVNTVPPSCDPTSGTASTSFAFDSGTWTGTPTSWSWESSPAGEDDWTEFSTEENPAVLGSVFGIGSWDTRLTATNAGGASDPATGDTITVGEATIAAQSRAGLGVGVGL